jgi:KUP system potassium uptake protein
LKILGGILLAVTGVEALFADLGHYNRQSIQWAFTLVVYPSLVIAYLGQAAALSIHPEWISNTFYNSIPGGPGSPVYWIVFVLATLATVIASQAMILATFSIVCVARMALTVDPSIYSIRLFSAFKGCSYRS